MWSVGRKFGLLMRSSFEVARRGRPYRAKYRTLSALISRLFNYFESREGKDEPERKWEPIEITPRRLKLAFRGAASPTSDDLAPEY
jgi:hypothetical protein